MSNDKRKTKPSEQIGFTRRQITAGIVIFIFGIAFGIVLVVEYQQSLAPEGSYSIHIEGDYIPWTQDDWLNPQIFEAQLVILSHNLSNGGEDTQHIRYLEILEPVFTDLKVVIQSQQYWNESTIWAMHLILSTTSSGIQTMTFFPMTWFNFQESAIKGEWLGAGFGFEKYNLDITLRNPGEE